MFEAWFFCAKPHCVAPVFRLLLKCEHLRTCYAGKLCEALDQDMPQEVRA